MTLRVRVLLSACLLSAAFPPAAVPQSAPGDSPLIEPRKHSEAHLGISPELPQAPLPPANLRADVSMVLVPTHVTTERGTPVNDLDQNSFHVFEDGVEQPITYFAWEDAPVSVGFLLDSSASMRNKMRQASEAASEFFNTANKDDEFFLVEFNEKPKLLLPFTADAHLVSDRVSHVRPIGRTSLLDAVHLALVQMKHARNPRKALVIVSDGGDNRSRYTYAEIKDLMIEAGVQIYCMGIYDPEDQRKRTPEEAFGPELMNELAQESGGKQFYADNPDQLPGIAEKIGEELRSQYVIGYAPANPERDGRYRHINVKLTPPKTSGLDVRYRRGYYAPLQ